MAVERVHLLKLCVGAEAVADLEAWQRTQRAQRRARGQSEEHVHVTRMWPRREEELLDGGSLYWVFKGLILARQRILRLDEVIGSDGVRRCGIVLDDPIHRTAAQPRRPFQGWRYLNDQDVPPDLDQDMMAEQELPSDLQAALADMGVR